MWKAAAASASPSPLLFAAAAWPRPPHKTLHLTSSRFLMGPTFIFSPPSSSSPLRSSAGAAGARIIGAWSNTATMLQDAGATALVLAGAYSLVLAFDRLTQRNLIEQSLSRKVVHVLSGVLFMSSWPVFSSSAEARYFAAIIPLANCIRLISYGLCLVTDEGLINSVTREGKPEELLRGPLYYVLVLMFCTLVFWRESPVGIIMLAMMSGGDGFADIVGRRYGAVKLPYNRQKSWIGSISMFISGFLFSIGMLYYFSAFGYFRLDWWQTVEKLAVVSLTATVVESLPVSEIIDDNISVPLSSMLMAILVFGYGPYR